MPCLAFVARLDGDHDIDLHAAGAVDRYVADRRGGVAAATALFSLDPGPLALIAIIILCQGAAEIAVKRSYGFALLFFTPWPSA